MANLIEKRLETVRLTSNQKKVLTRIHSAPTPKKAAEEASKGRSLLAARDILIKLGLITADDNEAALTPQGEKMMNDENLVDDAGELTDDGNKFAYDDVKESIFKSLNDTLKLIK